jgi:hypothetical protein
MFVGKVRSLPIEWSNLVLRNYLQLLNLTEKSYRSQHSSLFWYSVSGKKSFIRIDKKDRIFFSGSSIPGKGSNSFKAAKSDSILDGFSSGSTDRSLDPTDEPDQLRFFKEKKYF